MTTTMKLFKVLAGATLALAFLTTPGAALAVDQTNKSTGSKPKPDKLTTCPVSGEKLGEMGKPFVFEYKGQEVKLCCKHCRPDFDKDPEKYVKKIREADQPRSKSSNK